MGSTIRSGTGQNFKSLSPFNRTMGTRAINAQHEKRMEQFEKTRTLNDDKALKEIEKMQRRYEEVKQKQDKLKWKN